MRKLWLFAGILVAVTPLRAISITEPARIFATPSDIGDLQDPPLGFVLTVTDSTIASLTRVEIGLHLVGAPAGSGFASEMYVALNKNLTQSSILLNRAGLSSTDDIGAYYDGWNVTFRDDAANGDIHLAAIDSGVLTGIWQPDGRADPLGNSRLQMLSQFNGGTGNGDWLLSVGDMELGGTMRLVGWSLTLSGDTLMTASVPDGGSTLTMFLGAVLGVGCLVRVRNFKRWR